MTSYAYTADRVDGFSVTFGEAIERFEYAPERYLRHYGYDIASRELQRSFGDAAARPGSVLVAVEGDLAMAVVVPNAYLSQHFDVPIAHVLPIVSAVSDDRSELVRTALRRAAREAHAEGLELLIHRVEADDVEGVQGAAQAGMRLLETSTTWVNDANKAEHQVTYAGDCSFTVHYNGDVPDWSKGELDAILGLGSRLRLVGDHYHTDRRLSDSRADDLFSEWARRSLFGELGEVLVCVWREGVVVGFGGWQLWSHFDERYGLRILGDGFGYVLPDAAVRSCSRGIADAVGNVMHLDCQLLEWTTQATNAPMTNVLAARKSLRYCKAAHVFHGWTDEILAGW